MANLLGRGLYSFCLLCGLAREENEPSNILDPPEVAVGNQPAVFVQTHIDRLTKVHAEIADRRMEETAAYQRVAPW